MINPIWLRSFCTLVDIGHFTKTAEALHMTQSGVSQHIRKLEDLIGQPLLIREGKKFSVTSAGERLYQEGIALLQSIADLEQRVSKDPTYEGVVRIASPGSVGLKLYPYLLALQRRYSRLIIEYVFAPNSEIERLLSARKLDIGLMTCLASMKDVSLRPIAEEALLLVTPAAVSEPSWEALLSLGFVNHPDGEHHAGQLLSVNFPQYQHYTQFKRSGFSNQINLILEPVSLGLGFTVLPSYAVGAFAHPERVKVHRLTNEVSETLYIGCHQNAFTPNRVKTVMAEIEQGLQSSKVCNRARSAIAMMQSKMSK